MIVELIGVPFDGYGRPGNQALASRRLREAGLIGAFAAHGPVDRGDLDLPTGSGRRGLTSLINEEALVAMTAALRVLVRDSVLAGRVPVVYGGDCSALLGIVLGLGDGGGAPGLVHVDGHEDTMPLDVSEDGEAANVEIGLLVGITGRTLRGPLAEGLSALSADRLALLGQRDARWRGRFNVASLRDRGVLLRDVDEVTADPAGAGRVAVAHVREAADRWWLHVDLDVLDPEVLAAQGLPGVEDEPGGLGWDDLTTMLRAAIATGGCAGVSLMIYDPEQDPAGTDAERIVALARDLAAEL